MLDAAIQLLGKVVEGSAGECSLAALHGEIDSAHSVPRQPVDRARSSRHCKTTTFLEFTGRVSREFL